MAERPRFFDDLAGVAGGAFSALAGMREEIESTVRARVDEAIRRLDLVKREDLEAVQEMAAAARAGQEALEKRLAGLELDVLRSRLTMVEAQLAVMKGGAAGTTGPAPTTGAAANPAASGSEAAPASAPPAQTDSGTPIAPLA